MRESLPKEFVSDTTPNKEVVESVLREWLVTNPEIDWDKKEAHCKELESLLGSGAHVHTDNKTIGEFHIVLMDDNQKFMGVCEMYCQSETFQWLQC